MKKLFSTALAFEKVKREFIMPAIKHEFDRVVALETAQAEKHLRESLKKLAERIAIRLNHTVNVEHDGSQLTIVFYDASETAKVKK